MTKPIAIILGEPNSISSEIIFKSWIKKKFFRHNPCLVIGNYNFLYKHLKYFKFNLKLKLIEIEKNKQLHNFSTNYFNQIKNSIKIKYFND